MSEFAQDVLDELKVNAPEDSEDHELLSNSPSGGTDQGAADGGIDFGKDVATPATSFVHKLATGKLFDELTQAFIESDSMILWKSRETRTIDLRVMIDNEQDAQNTQLIDVPNSTILSVIRDKDRKKSHQINQSLLQVVVHNQIAVFDLSDQRPKEIFFFNATNQFMDPERAVESGI